MNLKLKNFKNKSFDKKLSLIVLGVAVVGINALGVAVVGINALYVIELFKK